MVPAHKWNQTLAGGGGFQAPLGFQAAGTLQEGAPLCQHWHQLPSSTSMHQLTPQHQRPAGPNGFREEGTGLGGCQENRWCWNSIPEKTWDALKNPHVSNNWKGKQLSCQTEQETPIPRQCKASAEIWGADFSVFEETSEKYCPGLCRRKGCLQQHRSHP